uniref:AlNc14C698G12413 protein n=1 Tax=Albugo laibachii Nc14 TaxID=890382 RepID=F0X1V0_9STRA|nr:AlNc14C698G12413 [Albugo laibachii Nc14]|eukprot:CCA27806.1 AlNc14C698G12413 [Albugo laibachii Nc14]
MHTRHTTKHIVDACSGSICPELGTEAISHEECDAVHATEFATNHGLLKAEEGRNIVRKVSSLKCYNVSLDLKGRPEEFYPNMINSMKELPLTREPSAGCHLHWLNMDAQPVGRSYLLLWCPSGVREGLYDFSIRISVSETDLANCYRGYQEQFDASPIENEILVYTEPAPFTDYSEYALAYYEQLDTEMYPEKHAYADQSKSCRECLERIALSTTYDFSNVAFLVRIRPELTTTLRKCISNAKEIVCNKLVFIPRDVCVHDLKITEIKEF